MSTEMELEIVAYLKEPLVEAPSSGHQRLKEGCNVLDRQSDRQKGEREGEGEGQRGRESYNDFGCKLQVACTICRDMEKASLGN